MHRFRPDLPERGGIPLFGLIFAGLARVLAGFAPVCEYIQYY